MRGTASVGAMLPRYHGFLLSITNLKHLTFHRGEVPYRFHGTGNSVNNARQLFVVGSVFLSLVLALWPMHETNDSNDSVSLFTIASTPMFQHYGSENGTAEHKHRHEPADYRDCQAEAGHCASGVPAIGVDNAGLIVLSSARAKRIYGIAFPAGLQPLPLLHPPERI